MATSFPDGGEKDDILRHMEGRYAEFYENFVELKRTGAKLRGRCPLHNGKDPNFQVDTDTGHWQCFSQCGEGGDIFSFVQKFYNTGFPIALEHVATWLNVRGVNLKLQFEPPKLRPAPDPIPLPDVTDLGIQASALVSVYDYVDENYNVLYQVLRYLPKRFSQRTPDGNGGYIWDTKQARKVPYRLPEVLEAIQVGKPIWIVEGEKDADRLHSLGMCATTNVCGSKAWLDEYAGFLHGAKVIIVPDNDDPGRKHAEKVAKSVHKVASQLRIVTLPVLGEHDDVSDYLDAGGTKRELFTLAKEALDWKPPVTIEIVREPVPTLGTYVPSLDRIVDLADVALPPPELPYLFGPYLNKGASHWVTGQTGLGKSTIMYNIMTALAEGRELWGIPCEQQRVLYVDAESGDIGRSMKVDRLYGDNPRVRDHLYFARIPYNLPDDMGELLAFVLDKGITIVVFDTARRCFKVKDENDNAEVYRSIIPTLDRLKAEGIATVTMGHPAKSGAIAARGAGAQEDAGDVNLFLSMYNGQIADKDGIIQIMPTKNRLLGMGTPPLYLRRTGDDQFERWYPGQSAAADGQQVPDPPASALDSCTADIKDMLCVCPNRRARHCEIMTATLAKGHSSATVNRALQSLKITGDLVKAEDGQWVITDPFDEDDF